ncbi:FecR family protein [Dawidia soli]|uniref:FecR domain-containing protein n=1 Tax=Dawidia soli TaxID=2782352 RepID=A0AAP2GJS3_9BACT|nr:FecR domain-containing protein [Dawidia soli]MBT1688805.1 FecR domain-containing protein [Dawidia soli]
MTKEEFLKLLDRYLAGKCTAAERQSLDRFFATFQEDGSWQESWRLTERERIKLDIYTSLNRQIEEEQATGFSVWRRAVPMVLRVAATVVVALGLGWLAYTRFDAEPSPRYITQKTVRGQRATVTLADGSVVRLNAQSQITYPEKFTTDTREVQLTGEAFFDVHRDPEHPFIVHAQGLKTSVLGTSFNIRAEASAATVQVTVKTGSVQVEPEANDSRRLVLAPAQQATYTRADASLTRQTVALERYLAWTDDIIYLDNTPIREMVETLEKWYGVTISLEQEALGNCLISGKYKSDQLVNILEGLEFMQGITYRFVNNRTIILSGNPCNNN